MLGDGARGRVYHSAAMRHSVRARLLQTLVCAGCALALPGVARAGGSPLHIDPASPVAKEYALPLATARGAPPESGQSGKLFGSGIKHSSAVTSHATATPQATPPPPPTTTATTPPPATTEPPATVEPPATTPPNEQPSGATTDTTAAPTQTQTRPRRRHSPEHVTTVTLPLLTRPSVPTKTGPVTARATPAAYRVLRPGSGSGLLWMALAAVAVIGLGSAGGITLRRRR